MMEDMNFVDFFLLMRIFDELLGGRFSGISETG